MRQSISSSPHLTLRKGSYLAKFQKMFSYLYIMMIFSVSQLTWQSFGNQEAQYFWQEAYSSCLPYDVKAVLWSAIELISCSEHKPSGRLEESFQSAGMVFCHNTWDWCHSYCVFLSYHLFGWFDSSFYIVCFVKVIEFCPFLRIINMFDFVKVP